MTLASPVYGDDAASSCVVCVISGGAGGRVAEPKITTH